MGSTSDKHRAMIRMLQHSILQLCNEHVGYSHKLQILGVLCMTIDDESQEVVIKVNNTLKRVPTSGNSRDTAPSVAPTPIPIPGHSITQTQPQQINAQQFSSPKAGMGMFTTPQNSSQASTTSTPIASPAFVVSPSGLISQHHSSLLNSINMNSVAANANNFLQNNNNNKEKKSAYTPRSDCVTPVNASQSSSQSIRNGEVTDLSTSLTSPRSTDKNNAPTPTPKSSPAKKSVGRKARKPMRVDCVYDEGEMIMNEDNDFLTVIPTDPDSVEDEVTKPIESKKKKVPTATLR